MENKKVINKKSMEKGAIEPLLTVRNVSLSYNLRSKNPFKKNLYWALRDVSFDLNPGDSLGVVGRNGAGKSTLLQLIAGIMEPDSGTLEFRPNTTTSLLSLNLGLLPQLTGRENAIQSALFQGIDLKEFKTKMDDIKEFSELGDFFDQPVSSYSSGMRARLGFSVSIQINPTILLVDELLGVGDLEFKKKAQNMMKSRIKSNDQTVVLVTHQERIVRQVCNKVIWIEDGKVVMSGETKTVLAEYASKQTSPQSSGKKV